MIKAVNLTKSFGSRKVLRGLSMSIEPGEIVSLIGMNGAGKSTLVRIMAAIGLYNTSWAVIFPTVGWPFGVFLMKQFSETLPSELLEAARIDGAGDSIGSWPTSDTV